VWARFRALEQRGECARPATPPIEGRDRILPREDPDASEVITEALRADGVAVREAAGQFFMETGGREARAARR
jgi:hypothetical protein